MNIPFIRLAVLSLTVFLATSAHAGYWHDSSGNVWRNSAGECWRTGYWAPDMIIVGCDGRTAVEAAPTPVAEPAPVPAPKPEPVATSSAEATVNFGFDRAGLDQAATSAIDQMLQRAESQGRIKSVKLTGHTDRIGTDGYNLDLSLRRASSVSDYLVDRAGVDPQIIEIAGKGESEPLVGCEGMYGAAAIRCLAPNRRVDILLDLF